MKRIGIERYTPALVTEDGEGWGGIIEGTRDDDSTWIMFLDQNGSPTVFWGQRDEGGVVGEGVTL